MSPCQQWKSCVPLFCRLFFSFFQHCCIWQHSTFAVQILWWADWCNPNAFDTFYTAQCQVPMRFVTCKVIYELSFLLHVSRTIHRVILFCELNWVPSADDQDLKWVLEMSELQLMLRWNGSTRNWFWEEKSPFKNRDLQRRARRRDCACSWNCCCCLIHHHSHQWLLQDTITGNYIWLPCQWSHPADFREKRVESWGEYIKKICSVEKPPIHSVNVRSQMLEYLQQSQLGFPHQEDVHPTVSNKTSFRVNSKIFKTSSLALGDQ